MAIVISCASCNIRLTLGDDRGGDRFECPQCDATIKVPLTGPPLATPAPLSPATKARALELEPEPIADRRTDKRVLAGIIAGIAALLLVGVVVTVVAFRKPTETAKPATDPVVEPPSQLVAQPAVAPPKTPPEVKPQGGVSAVEPPRIETPVQPVAPGPVLPSQFNAQFLGSQGQGRRFCIIADNSGSMGGANLADLKVQLVKTLANLNQEGEFYIFAFNSVAEPMPHPGWLKGGAPEVGKVKTWIGELKARGGTKPEPAFEAAFKLSPRPDVIFFMTDGLIPAVVPARVVALNGTEPKVVVNTIMFTSMAKGGVLPKGTERAEEMLKKIAEQSGGTFTRYVP